MSSASDFAFGTSTCIAIAGLTVAIIALAQPGPNIPDTSGFLKTDGTNEMEANLPMNGFSFNGLSNIALENTPNIPTPGNGLTGFFSTGGGNLTQIDQDGNTYTYLTSEPSGDFLPRDGSLPMLGNLDMGTNSMLNLVSIATPSITGNVVFGSGTTLTQTSNQRNVLLGINHVVSGQEDTLIGFHNNVSGGNENIVIGVTHTITGDSNACYGSNTNSITGSVNTIVGSQNTIVGFETYVLGDLNSILSGTTQSCIVGRDNTINTNVMNGGIFGFGNTIGQNNCFVLGNNASNNLVNTMCLGDGLTNVYPFTDNAMSLGTSTQRFENQYLSNNVYILGLTVPVAQYSLYAPATVANTTTETVYSGSSFLGSLFIPALQVGAVIRVTVNFLLNLASTSSGDALHLYLNNATTGTKLASPFYTLPTNTPLINVIGTLSYTVVVRDTANVYATSIGSLAGATFAGTSALALYNSPDNQTLTLSAQFDLGVNVSFTAEQVIMERMFTSA